MSLLCNMLQKWLYLISGLSDFISVRETCISRAWAILSNYVLLVSMNTIYELIHGLLIL